MPEAGRYRMAMRNHLFFTNRLLEAGAVTRRPPRGGIARALEDEQPRHPRRLGPACRRRLGAQARGVALQPSPDADTTDYGDRPEGRTVSICTLTSRSTTSS